MKRIKWKCNEGMVLVGAVQHSNQWRKPLIQKEKSRWI
jgi:hypothetical protein